MIQPQEDGLAGVGCAGRVVAFSETDNGRMLIQLRAVSRFRLVEAEEGFQPYLTGRADWSGFGIDLGGTESDPDWAGEGGSFDLGTTRTDRPKEGVNRPTPDEIKRYQKIISNKKKPIC